MFGRQITGAILTTGSIALLIFGLSQGQQHGFTNAATLTALALAVLLGVTFVIFQERAETPMLPRHVLADPARRAALLAMLLFGPVVAGYVYFTSLYNQDVLHFSPLGAGLAFIPATATVMLTATQLTRRIQVGNAIGLAALATIAATVTNAHHGSLVSGYKAAFLASIGLSVLAVLNVAIHMRTPTAPKGTA